MVDNIRGQSYTPPGMTIHDPRFSNVLANNSANINYAAGDGRTRGYADPASTNVPNAPVQHWNSAVNGFYSTIGSSALPDQGVGTFYYTQDEAAYRRDFFQRNPNFYADAMQKMDMGMSYSEAMQQAVDGLSYEDRRNENFESMFNSGRLVQTIPGSGATPGNYGVGGAGGAARVTANDEEREQIDISTAVGVTDDKRQRRQALIATGEEGLLETGSVGRQGLLGD